LGKARPGEQILVSGSWKKDASATADAKGKWRLQLATPLAGGPYTIEIKTSDSTIRESPETVGNFSATAYFFAKKL